MSVPVVAVIGGGIAGLAAAWELRAAQSRGTIEAHLFEGSPRLGGSIRTDRGSGLLIEGGPDSFLTTRPEALQLVRELGLEAELLRPRPEAAGTYIYRDGRLHRAVPFLGGPRVSAMRGVLSSPLLGWPGRLRLASGSVGVRLRPLRVGDDVPLAPELRRRFGAEATDWLFEPLLAGFLSTPLDAMSTRTVARYLPAGWTRRGPEVADEPAPTRSSASDGSRPAARFVTIRSGMDRLPEALRAGLSPVSVHEGRRVEGLARAGGRYLLRFAEGANLEADGVVLAVPAREARRLLVDVAPTAHAALDAFRTSALSVVGCVFDRSDLSRPLDAGGVLVPRRSGLPISAVTWLSSKWDRAEGDGPSVALRVFVPAAPDPSGPSSEAAAVWAAREGLETVMGLDAVPRYTVVFHHELGRPWFDSGHAARVRLVRSALSELPALRVCGAAFEGAGLPAAIRSGRNAARTVLGDLAAPTTAS